MSCKTGTESGEASKVRAILGHGKTIVLLGTEFTLGLMGIGTKVSGSKVLDKDTALTSSVMVINTSVSTFVASPKVKASTSGTMEICTWATSKKE